MLWVFHRAFGPYGAAGISQRFNWNRRKSSQEIAKFEWNYAERLRTFANDRYWKREIDWNKYDRCARAFVFIVSVVKVDFLNSVLSEGANTMSCVFGNVFREPLMPSMDLSEWIWMNRSRCFSCWKGRVWWLYSACIVYIYILYIYTKHHFYKYCVKKDSFSAQLTPRSQMHARGRDNLLQPETCTRMHICIHTHSLL